MEHIKPENVQKIIDVLNTARAMELQAISQYMNQHYSADAQDYGEFARNLKLIAIDEMRHAETFAERIKELGGEPVADPLSKIERGQKIEEIFGFDAKLESETIAKYTEFQRICMENGDPVSQALFQEIIGEENIHLNYFETVQNHIRELGSHYLARIAGTEGKVEPVNPGFVGKKKKGAS